MPIRLPAALAALALVVPHAAAQPKSKPPAAPPPKQLKPPEVPPELADWTPRPATGPVEPWEKATDKDWVDGRFRKTDTGPFLNATFRYPLGQDRPWVYKGTAIKLGEKGEAAVLFDRASLRMAAGWTGGWVNISDRRFGLLNTSTPSGELVFATAAGPEWADRDGKWEPKVGPVGPWKESPSTSSSRRPVPRSAWDRAGVRSGVTAPLPAEWAQYRGLYVHGNRVVLKYTVNGATVLDSPRLDVRDNGADLVRTLSIGPRKSDLRLAISSRWKFVSKTLTAPAKPAAPGEVVVGPIDDDTAFIPAGSDTRTGTIRYHLGPEPKPDDLTALTKPGPARWGKPIVTKLVRGDGSGPFAIDTLTLPYDNPFGALFFCTGLDFLPDGRVAVCTCHGDVWLAKVDEAAGTVAWKRFAAGLYQPLGLKVVDGKVVVLERGQLTRLHDLNGDDEADFYECVSNDWDTGPGEHSYDTCLETDPEGNFYFFKTGDTDLPTGGCLMKVSKDGSKAEVFATGFRHPIGLGMSPSGLLTGADQEGNWMPATRIDEYKKGGFYGDLRAHHRKEPPKIYDGPLCWVPREVDNSAGGQVWVPEGKFGPLGGLPLHLSYGRCKAFVLLRQPIESGSQGGVWDLGWHFLAGVCRGRFGPDGNLYVCGLNGWQTSAKADGCVQRVRYTGRPVEVPVGLEVVPDGVRLTFSRPLDKAAAEDPAHYRAAWWNYHWSGLYGSPRLKVSDPQSIGQDDVPVTAAKLEADGRTVRVTVAGGVRPVMQMQVGVNLKTADGRPVVGSVFLTVHKTGK